MTFYSQMSRMKHSTVAYTQSFAAALVRSELVALHTPALEPPFCVGTALAAVAFFSTFVHIWNRPQKQRLRSEENRDVGFNIPQG